MIRAFAAWSWLVSATGAVVMVAPHVPVLVLQAVMGRGKRHDCSGCSMPGGQHWDTCPNRWDGRPAR